MGEVLSALALMVAVLLVIAVLVGGMLMLTGGKLVERDPMDGRIGPLPYGHPGRTSTVFGKIEHAPEDH